MVSTTWTAVVKLQFSFCDIPTQPSADQQDSR